jgi:predicted MPP superfamily phosphohydrolase
MSTNNNKKYEESRRIWATTRAHLEADRMKYKRSGKKSKSHWSLFEKVLQFFLIFMKLFNIYKRGYQNAKNIKVNKIDLYFPDLPCSFENYKILHLSDLHIDSIQGLEDIICEKLNGLEYDLCVLTGDYRKSRQGSLKTILRPMKKLTDCINANDGIYAILGNHDTYLMAEYEDKINVKLLINETVFIKRGNDKIAVTGTDDPFYYFTDQAIIALDEDINCFKIALVHTPELYDVAAENGYNLYLCGHTHGGQICLPGGIPIITHQFEGRKFYKGLWKHNSITGYTSCGCGVSGIPLRFYCQGEITFFTLRKGEADKIL